MNYKHFFCLLLVIPSLIFGNQSALLKLSDINPIMNQIFEKHVDYDKMTEDLVQESIKVYIDQFDPARIYLLKSEVDPYFHMSGSRLQKVIKQYRNKNFSIYYEINDLIQKAIQRARTIRGEIEKNKQKLFSKGLDFKDLVHQDYLDPQADRSFPKNERELKSRIEEDLLQFIYFQKQRYGDRVILENQQKTLTLYEKEVREFENQYLFKNTKGQLLSSDEKENLMTTRILKSLAKSLDAHTSFLSSSEARDLKMRLEKGFVGIGVSLQEGIDGVVVVSLYPKSPAEKSGLIKENDRIVKINGIDISNLPFDQVAKLLRGKEGTKVTLVLKRLINHKNGEKEKTISVSLKREKILLNEERVKVESEPFEGGIIGKIKLDSFYDNGNGISAEYDVRRAIRKLDKQGKLKGLILDLRDNRGGYLMQAVKVAGLFITNGVVVISKLSHGEKHIYRDIDGKTIYDGPLVILTSLATASAAEIVAQALQDYGVGIVVGDKRTYGKGSIQSQTVTSDGTSTTFFKVTIGKYYTVSGKTPQIQGVKADIVVPGEYSSGLLGEKFLENHLTHDQIDPLFVDKLSDIDPRARTWFLKYYMPTLQLRKSMWKKALPKLRKKSAQRIANNQAYQSFLSHLNKDISYAGKKLSYDQNKDYQMDEAVNILKDMIRFKVQSTVKNR